VKREDAIHAATNYVWSAHLDDESRRQLRLGFSRDGSPLETVVIAGDDGELVVIHAMAMRLTYRTLLGRAKRQ
jgi:hypothetical protein